MSKTKLLLGLLIGLILVINIAYAGTVTYNTGTKSLTKIYRYNSSAGTFSANLAGTTVFDYFDDTAVVNDAIYFSPGNSYAFSDILVDVGTPLVATSITIVWEYYQQNVGWTALSNMQDDTNGFQNAGANIVRFPSQWDWYITTINGSRHSWIRARITAVSGITEGGANQNTAPYSKDGCVDIDGYTDGSPCSFTTVSNYLEANYPYLGTIKTGQYFDFRFIGLDINSRLKSTNELIETHNGASSVHTIFRSQKWHYLELGIKVGTESGRYGSVIYVNAGANTYPFEVSSNFKMYGSTLRSPNAQAGYPTLYGEYLDCNLELRPRLTSSATMINNRIYLGGGLIQGGAFPSVFIKNKFVLYTQLALVYQGGFTAVEMDYEFIHAYRMIDIYQTYTDVDWIFINPVTPLPSQASAPYMIKRGTPAGANIINCYNYDNTSGFTDQTTEANNDAIDDVNVTGKTGDPEVGDIIYIGLGSTWHSADTRFDITMGSVLNTDNTYIWEIYAEGAWREALIWDGTYNFTQTGKIWIGQRANDGTYMTTTTINGVNQYYIRARVTSAGNSKPLITKIQGATEPGVARWHAYEKYTIAINVIDKDGNGIENTNVTVKSQAEVQQFSVKTDANGDIAEQDPIITRDFYFDPLDSYDSPYQVADVATPEYTITITHQDYPTKKFDFNLTSKVDWTIALKDRPNELGHMTVFGTEYCEGDLGEARAFIRYGNETPSNDATVSIKLWDGTQTTMTFVENGMYQYNFTAPAYSSGGKNVYFFYVNSSNPTSYGTGEFTVKNCDKLTTTQNTTLYDINDDTDSIITSLSTLVADIWNHGTKIITGGVLTTPNDYKADISTLSTQSNITDLQTHGDSTWVTAVGFATQDNLTDGIILLTPATETQINTIESNSNRILNATEIRQSQVNDLSASSTKFITTLTEADNSFWDRSAIIFTSGNNEGQIRAIKNYAGGTKQVTLQTPLNSAPSNGDNFVIIPARKFLTPDVTELADAIWDENMTNHNNTGSFGKAQQSYYRIQMSDFKAIVAGNVYYTKLNSFDYNGNPSNLSESPTITIYDALRNIIVNEAELTYVSEGLYAYAHTTSTSATGGLWESVILSNYSNNEVYLNDYWQISSSPADVEIIDIIDLILPSIVAETEITNMGTQPSDFEYVYCIVESPAYKCGDGHDIDYQSGTRYILAGHVWNAELGLEVTNEGIYYFKLKAKALGETNWAGASKMFNASFKREGHYPILDISKECIINTDCPVGYFCYENKCKRLICKENEQLSQDGHSCIEKIEPEKHTILWLIVLAFAGFMLFLFIIFKREEEICVMGKTYGG